MKPLIDLTLNVLLPIIIGGIVYAWDSKGLIRNFLPDALWAYAFASSILIIWRREIQLMWTTIMFMAGGLFELLQYMNVIGGTGDIYDVLVYYNFFILAFLTNHFFKPKKLTVL